MLACFTVCCFYLYCCCIYCHLLIEIVYQLFVTWLLKASLFLHRITWAYHHVVCMLKEVYVHVPVCVLCCAAIVLIAFCYWRTKNIYSAVTALKPCTSPREAPEGTLGAPGDRL